jgi:hypothetical protein
MLPKSILAALAWSVASGSLAAQAPQQSSFIKPKMIDVNQN